MNLTIPTPAAIALGQASNKVAASRTIAISAADARGREMVRIREMYERMSDRNLYLMLEENNVAGASGAYKHDALVATAIRVHLGKVTGGASATKKRKQTPKQAAGVPAPTRTLRSGHSAK